MPSSGTAGRRALLDAIRGAAVVIMIFYHLVFDLRAFGDERFAMFRAIPAPGFRAVAGLIATLFIGVSGAAAWMGRNSVATTRPWWRRSGVQLLGACVAVTAGSAIFDASNVILFGILHFLLLARLILPPFLRWRTRWLLASAGALIATAPFLENIHVQNLAWIWLGLSPAQWKTGDYFPLVPWMSVMFLGVAWARRVESREEAVTTATEWPSPLITLGRHSLVIYLVHQPVLMGLLKLAGWIRL